MRQLRVVATTADDIILAAIDTAETADETATGENGVMGERFVLTVDDHLHDALRGRSRPRSDQHAPQPSDPETPMTSQLSPREIQRRIRAGATVAELALGSDDDADRIERFAYPILLERDAVATRARAACPLADATMGTPSAAAVTSSLEEIVTSTLSDRGQHRQLHWDAHRDEGEWIITLTWSAGRTENRAEWCFTPHSGGNELTARNTHAQQLVEPEPMALHTIGTASEQLRLTTDEHSVADTVTDARSASGITAGTRDTTTPTASSGRPRHRSHRPPMPSWEDVLLGTRAAK